MPPESPWADVVIPDDIRELSRDVAAYRREVRREARTRRLRALAARRATVPLLALTVCGLVAAVIAGMLTVMAPRVAVRPPAAAPLATPDVVPGRVGGLLPMATMRGPDGSVDTHAAQLRPAVFALVPPRCACHDLLNALAGQAYSENLRLAIVVPAASDPTTDTLAASLNRGRPVVYYDASATLATSVASRGVTAVLIDDDGTIYDIERNITDPTLTSVDAALQSMLLPAPA